MNIIMEYLLVNIDLLIEKIMSLLFLLYCPVRVSCAEAKELSKGTLACLEL